MSDEKRNNLWKREDLDDLRALEGVALAAALLTLVWQRMEDEREGHLRQQTRWHTDDEEELTGWHLSVDLPEDLVHAIYDWSDGEYELVRAFLNRTDGR